MNKHVDRLHKALRAEGDYLRFDPDAMEVVIIGKDREDNEYYLGSIPYTAWCQMSNNTRSMLISKIRFSKVN